MKPATAFLTVAIILLLPLMEMVAGQAPAVRGRMVLDVGKGWEASHLWKPSVVYNGTSFMMWYGGKNSTSLQVDNIGLATSTDGITWTRSQNNPVLNVGPPGSWDCCSVNEPSVVHDESGYKMWYTGWLYNGGTPKRAIGLATSTDGVKWTKYPGNPVLTRGPPGSFDDSRGTYPEVIQSDGYTMYYRGVSTGGESQIGMATSQDGIRWTKKGVVAIPSSWWASSSNARELTGVTKVGEVFVGSYDGLSMNPSDPMSLIGQIGLATSIDGINWTPYSGNPVITYGSGTSWDAGGVVEPFILTVGDNYYVYYTADNNKAGSLSRETIGLAVLPASQYQVPELAAGRTIVAMAALVMITALLCRRSKITEPRSI